MHFLKNLNWCILEKKVHIIFLRMCLMLNFMNMYNNFWFGWNLAKNRNLN